MSTTTRNTIRMIPVDETPRIGDLVPGVVVFRRATPRTKSMVAELPCHQDQVVGIVHHDGARSVLVDQPVVCRRCGTSYAATPVPATSDHPHHRVVYRHTGVVGMSHPKRRIDRV